MENIPKDIEANKSTINSLESSLKDPVRCAPLIWSTFKHFIFVNDPALSDLASDALTSNARPSTTSVP